MIEVWNKADLLPRTSMSGLQSLPAQGRHPAVLVSAVAGEGLAALAALIRQRLQKRTATRTVVVGHAGGPLIHWLYENTEILSRRDDPDGGVEFEVRVPQEREGDLERHLRRAAH